jgi:acyl dehydratase
MAPALSEAAIARARKLVGSELPAWPWNTVATEDAIRHFCFGVGDDNPLWWDRDYAADSPIGLTAPPTFLYTQFSGGPWPTGNPGAALEVLPGSIGLWGEDRWRWFRRIKVGESLTTSASLHSLRETQTSGGERMVVQTERYDMRSGAGETVAELYRTLLRFEPRDPGDLDRSANIVPYRYSEAELDAIERQYDLEQDLRRGRDTRYLEEVTEGLEVGPMVKGPLSIGGIAAFIAGLGAPNLPTNRIARNYVLHNPGHAVRHGRSGALNPSGAKHLDADLVGTVGFASGFDIGSQRISWIAHTLTDWMSDEGELIELNVRIKRPNFVGDVTWISGEVTMCEALDDKGRVHCALTGTNQRGEETTTARAIVLLPKQFVH